MMFRLLLSSFLLWILLSAPASACPSRGQTPNDYIRRDNNRCEGVRPRSVVGGSVELISLTSSRGGSLGRTLTILVPGSSQPNVLIRAIESRYQLDQMTLSQSGNSYTFSLPTRVLTAVNIPLTDLRATATRGTQVLYVPVILNQGTNQYRFVFYSASNVRFTRAEIRRNGQVFASWGPQNYRQGEKAFEWTDPASAPAGRYEFFYSAEIQQRSGPPEVIERRITFEHDPSWLR